MNTELIHKAKRLMAELEVMFDEWSDLDLGTQPELDLFDRITKQQDEIIKCVPDLIHALETTQGSK